MRKLIIAAIAVVSVGSLGLAAYFYFKKKQLWNPQPVKVSSIETEPISPQAEEQPEEEPAPIPELIRGQGNIPLQPEIKPAPTPTPVTPIAPAEPKTVQSTIPSAKELTTATTKNTGFVTPALKPAAATIKPALKVVKAPAVAAKPKQVTPTPKTIVKAPAKPTTRVLKPVQKASAVKRLSGDGWLEAAADDMEGRFYGTI